MSFSPEHFRAAFPVFAARPDLAYLDNGATTQMAAASIDAIAEFERDGRANVKRSVHTLAEKSTRGFNEARQKVAAYLGGVAANEVAFTSGTTAALNILAHGLCQQHSGKGKRVLVSVSEHHSNIVPWQIAGQIHGLQITPLPVDSAGRIDLAAAAKVLDESVAAIAVAHISNVTGARHPIEDLAGLRDSHAPGAALVVDGAQGVGHGPVDVAALGADFYAFSAHKMFGPTGVGVLWGKAALLADLPPLLGGGEMIRHVSFSGTQFAAPPHRFEAGTPPFTQAIGLAAAIDFLSGQDQAGMETHLQALTAHCWHALAAEGLPLYGPKPDGTARGALVSFTVPGAHPHDICQILDDSGVALRGGHHCAQPLMEHFGVAGTVRASFAPYNTIDDIEKLVAGLAHARRLLGLVK